MGMIAGTVIERIDKPADCGRANAGVIE